MSKERCRCYINAKHYAQLPKSGGAGWRGYRPCPIHEAATPRPTLGSEPEKRSAAEALGGEAKKEER